jgi:exopolysaccharide biosynthesis polyprenyl glycosylphosphotransferase
MTILLGTFIFGLKVHYISRLFVGIFGVSAFLLLLFQRLAMRGLAKILRRKGWNTRNVLIVGSGKRARELAKTVLDHKEWGLKLLGMVAERGNGNLQKVRGYPVLGSTDKIGEILNSEIVDEVLFAVSRKRLEEFEEIFLLCEKRGVRARVAINFFPHTIAKVCLEEIDGIPLLTFSTTPHNEFVLALKRGFDILVSSAALILFLPFFLPISFAILATSPGPVFFKQTRVSLNGRHFTLYKFRSMVANAEEKKQELLHLNQMEGPVFKMEHDPRVTRVGRFLRKTSLDEFPQFLNVLKGDMSIIGPRPPLPEEVEKYQPWQRRRLSMRPGLTCLWQITGRNTIRDFEQWITLDLKYIDTWSLTLDLKIFLKTIPIVLLARGAR